MDVKQIKALIKKAKEARNQAYAPYSGFHVGAALLCSDGSIYTGCNIENASFGETICAERVAFTKAISEGECSFYAIAIAGEDDAATPPCGACLQVMSEFCGPSFQIFLESVDGRYKALTLGDLLPNGFKLSPKDNGN